MEEKVNNFIAKFGLKKVQEYKDRKIEFKSHYDYLLSEYMNG
jgi:hypothetical protein